MIRSSNTKTEGPKSVLTLDVEVARTNNKNVCWNYKADLRMSSSRPLSSDSKGSGQARIQDFSERGGE